MLLVVWLIKNKVNFVLFSFVQKASASVKSCLEQKNLIFIECSKLRLKITRICHLSDSPVFLATKYEEEIMRFFL